MMLYSFNQVHETKMCQDIPTSVINIIQYAATRHKRVAKYLQHVVPTLLQFVALKCCYRLARPCKYYANNDVICCDEMFDSDFKFS